MEVGSAFVKRQNANGGGSEARCWRYASLFAPPGEPSSNGITAGEEQPRGGKEVVPPCVTLLCGGGAAAAAAAASAAVASFSRSVSDKW
jgi:hypothetical protein